jgi:hypothetical protein
MSKSVLHALAPAAALAGAFTLSPSARAAGEWGIHTGDTMGNGETAPYGEFGWPDVSFGVAHGAGDRFDVGGRWSLLYGPFYTTRGTLIGMAMAVPLRLGLARSPKFSALLHIDPGVKFAHFDSPLLVGPQFPVGAEFGVHLVREATLQLGFNMPFYVNLTNTKFVNIPVLFGFGFEYHADEHIAVGINTRYGVSAFAGDYFRSDAQFGLLAQGYFGYRL